VLFDLLGELVMEEKLLAYVSRMTGEQVAAGTQVILSSTQRVQLIGWLNAQGVTADINRFKSNLISVDQLLAIAAGSDVPDAPAGAAEKPIRKAPLASKKYSVGAAPQMLGVGIDIQPVDAMPEASDYRTDSFYKGNFSPRELAHCIEKGSPRESLAGIWAAKEALLKAGAASRPANGALGEIEISYDAAGAPRYPNCLISISHAAGVAVAVCIRTA
jgi:phosphopantetheine--protein transferase-like protein